MGETRVFVFLGWPTIKHEFLTDSENQKCFEDIVTDG